jgi:hypothetical protein
MVSLRRRSVEDRRGPVITPAVARIQQLVSRVFGRVEVVQIIRPPATPAEPPRV